MRFEPGEEKTVQLVAFAGAQIVRGGNALGEGAIDEAGRARLLSAVAARGFKHEEQPAAGGAKAEEPASPATGAARQGGALEKKR